MTDYRFTVHGPNVHKVVLWRTGTIDPGREWLRVATGSENPGGASVADYDPSTDADLPVETKEGPSAIVDGVPDPIGSAIVGPIVKSPLKKLLKKVFGKKF